MKSQIGGPPQSKWYIAICKNVTDLWLLPFEQWAKTGPSCCTGLLGGPIAGEHAREFFVEKGCSFAPSDCGESHTAWQTWSISTPRKSQLSERRGSMRRRSLFRCWIVISLWECVTNKNLNVYTKYCSNSSLRFSRGEALESTVQHLVMYNRKHSSAWNIARWAKLAETNLPWIAQLC